MKKKLNVGKILSFLAVCLLPFVLSGCGGSSGNVGYQVNLEMWGVSDDSTVYGEIINQYKKINPYVGDIKYRKFSINTYKQELLDALAAGQGPDIFMVHNSWLPSFENKLEPAPAAFVSESDMKTNFPDVVSADFIADGKAFAVPLSVDSMALYYNRDMFNAAGITQPPRTWQEFDEAVKKLTSIDSVGNIIRSGAAMGTAKNVNRAQDILSLLMMQNGAEMPSKKGALAKFDQGVNDSKGTIVQPGEFSLGYFTKFSSVGTSSNTMNPYYSWNAKQHESIDAFTEGSVGMMLSYSWKYDEIKKKNPKLNFGVAQVPQVNIDKPITYANYWAYAVSKNKPAPTTTLSGATTGTGAPTNAMRTHEAWEFLRFLAVKNNGTVTLYNAVSKNSKIFPMNFDPAADYIQKTKYPAARRDLIETQRSDSVLGTFAMGNLIAKSWYQADPDAVGLIFTDMIESVNSNSMTLREALVLAKNKVNSLQQR